MFRIELLFSIMALLPSSVFKYYSEGEFWHPVCLNFLENRGCIGACMLAHPARRVRIFHPKMMLLSYPAGFVICCKNYILSGDCQCNYMYKKTRYDMKLDMYFHPSDHIVSYLRRKISCSQYAPYIVPKEPTEENIDTYENIMEPMSQIIKGLFGNANFQIAQAEMFEDMPIESLPKELLIPLNSLKLLGQVDNSWQVPNWLEKVTPKTTDGGKRAIVKTNHGQSIQQDSSTPIEPVEPPRRRRICSDCDIDVFYRRHWLLMSQLNLLGSALNGPDFLPEDMYSKIILQGLPLSDDNLRELLKIPLIDAIPADFINLRNFANNATLHELISCPMVSPEQIINNLYNVGVPTGQYSTMNEDVSPPINRDIPQ